MFLAGNKVVGGLVGKHPSLSDLTDGDLKYHTDFRRVYATLLDDWLGVESRGVLGDKFEKLTLIDHKKKGPAVPPGGLPAPLPPGAVPAKSVTAPLKVESIPPTTVPVKDLEKD